MTAILTASSAPAAERLALQLQKLHSWTDLLAFANIEDQDREYVLKKIRIKGILAPFPRVRWDSKRNIITVDHEKFELIVKNGFSVVTWQRHMAVLNPLISQTENIDLAMKSLLDFKPGRNQKSGARDRFSHTVALLQLLALTHQSVNAEPASKPLSTTLAGILAATGLRGPSQVEFALNMSLRVRCSESPGDRGLISADIIIPIVDVDNFGSAVEFCKVRLPNETDCNAYAVRFTLSKIAVGGLWKITRSSNGDLEKIRLMKSPNNLFLRREAVSCEDPICKELSVILNKYCMDPNLPENQRIATVLASNQFRFDKFVPISGDQAHKHHTSQDSDRSPESSDPNSDGAEGTTGQPSSSR